MRKKEHDQNLLWELRIGALAIPAVQLSICFAGLYCIEGGIALSGSDSAYSQVVINPDFLAAVSNFLEQQGVILYPSW